MIRAPVLSFFLAALAAAQTPFDGRWVMHAPADPERRVFWMEIESSGPIRGVLFGATGGRMAQILEPVVYAGELRFRVERLFEGDPPRLQRAWTVVRRFGDRIEGITKIDEKEIKWVGWRAPELKDVDDGAWRDGTLEALFEDPFANFDTQHPGRAQDWAFENGVLRNASPKADLLVSRQKFWNFRLHLEYRLQKGGNAGFGLRGRYEVQLFDDFGQPADIYGNGSIYSRLAPSRNVSKPPGEWQSIDLTLIGRQVTIRMNDLTTIDHQVIDGLCGLATDPYEDRPGPITIQGDHGPIEYRNLQVTPLERPRRR